MSDFHELANYQGKLSSQPVVESRLKLKDEIIMGMTIMRRIKFCAGHRLYKHESKCAFFHGHNYVADFYVSSDEMDAVGRVVDFSVLKDNFKGWLDDHWDHGFLLYQEDSNAIHAIKQVEPCKYYLLPYNPTAENMARYLLEEVCPKLLTPLGVSATKVVIWETAEAFAEASINAATGGVLVSSCAGSAEES